MYPYFSVLHSQIELRASVVSKNLISFPLENIETGT